jgi:7,8-dihydroneopterin aldolase/epimerase/oxygenase
MSYVIRLRNCAFFARHGVHDEEERMGQRFYVDAELTVDAESALDHDRIAETVDYGAAFSLIEQIVTGRRRFLIEALAQEIGRSLCEQFSMIVQAVITIRKPNAPVNGVLDYVEVTVAWPR